MAGLREREVVAALLHERVAAPADWLVAPRDDAAVVPLAAWRDGRLVAATDGLEEGVHFRSGWQDPSDLGWKAVAVVLSDLAAMGAVPVGYLLSVSWPRGMDDSAARDVARGLRAIERAHEVVLLGGDTDVTDGPARLTVAALGRVASPGPVLRSGGRAGDVVFVTGPLGGPAAVVESLLAGEQPDASVSPWRDALLRFRRPAPRLDVGARLAGHAHAMMDLSDGLLPDLERLCAESGLAAVVERARVPVHAAALLRPEPERLALSGGEDYELLIAGPEDLPRQFPFLTPVGHLAAGVPGEVRCAA